MVKNDFCKGCIQRRDCKKVYEHLGKAQTPSVAWKVILAFLLPILVFIAGLAFFDWLSAGKIAASWLRILLGFLFSLVVTFVAILIIKGIDKLIRER